MKRKRKPINPLLMGMGGLLAQAMVLLVGGMSLWGMMWNDEQWQINRGVLRGFNTKQMVETAVKYGDWKTAEGIYQSNEARGVLGADTETEKLIWPEKVVEREIGYWNEVVKKTPSRYGFQKLSELYGRLGESDQSMEALKKAAEIDPNDVSVVGY